MGTSKAISAISHAARTTMVGIWGLCFHGKWAYMAEIYNKPYQVTYKVGIMSKIDFKSVYFESLAFALHLLPPNLAKTHI